MLTVARIVFFLFAALLILGGIDGFIAAHSAMSLMSGVLCGGMGLYAALTLTKAPKRALIVGLLGAILAGGGMAPRLHDKKTGELKIWPAVTVVAASALTAFVAAGGLASVAKPAAAGSTAG